MPNMHFMFIMPPCAAYLYTQHAIRSSSECTKYVPTCAARLQKLGVDGGTEDDSRGGLVCLVRCVAYCGGEEEE